MAWRIVKQPNKNLARFSDIVDDFTHMNMTKDEAIELCSTYMGSRNATIKVQAGIDDIKPWTIDEKGMGLARWMDCIQTIEMVHGVGVAQDRIETGGALDLTFTPK